jgi:hypothetical protein
MRERHAATLQHIAFLKNTASATPTFRPVPTVATKFLAIHLFQPDNNTILQVKQKILLLRRN